MSVLSPTRQRADCHAEGRTQSETLCDVVRAGTDRDAHAGAEGYEYAEPR